jgi:hypothetical protein
MTDTALTEHLRQLRASGWGDERADADQIDDLTRMRDELRQGHHLWSVTEILASTRTAQTMANRAGSPAGREALAGLAAELETHLPTPTRVEADAAQVRELAAEGATEEARARHLLLWTRVLETIGQGHGDARALAHAALGAYDARAERFVLDHLAEN